MKLGGRMGEWVRGNAVSLGFYAYAFLLAPPLSRVLKAGLAAEEPMPWPGVLLLAVLLVEPVGLRWKLQFLRRRNAEEGFEPEGGMMAVFSAAGIGHMLVTMFLGMTLLDCWGVVGAGSEGASGWWGAVIVGLILKEFAELLAGGGTSVSREAPGHGKERVADVFLLAYGCVAYTVWWEALIDLGAIAGAGGVEKLVLIPVLGGLFAFLYLPMRLPFLLDEHHLRPARGRKGRLAAEWAWGVALGLYPVFA